MVPPKHEVPKFDETPEVKALHATIAAHPAVVARLGAPAMPTSRPVNGNVRVEGADGDADIHIELGGPKGRAMVAVEAEMKDRVWTLQSVEME